MHSTIGAFVLLIISSIILLFGLHAFADTHLPMNESELLDESTENARPYPYLLEILLEDIGEIDKIKGSYEMDFRLEILPNGAPYLNETLPPTIEFINGRPELVGEPYCTFISCEYRYQGVFFNSEMNFKNYPFVKLDLPIIIEAEPPNNVNNVLFMVSENPQPEEKEVDPAWKITNSGFRIIDQSYPDTTFSRVIFTYFVESSFENGILKVIFPIFIISMLAVVPFWLPPKEMSLRLNLAVGGLLALVFFVETILASQLPEIAYLTLADHIGLTGYALFVYSIFSSIILKRQVPEDDEKKGEKNNSLLRLGIPVIISIFIVLLIV